MKRTVAIVSVLFASFGVNLPAGEIHDAATAGDLAKVKALLGANPALLESEDRDGETRETDVLLLTVKSRNARGLRPNTSNSGDANDNFGAGYYRGANVLPSHIAWFLEMYFEMPVLDRTGLAVRFDFNIRWPEQDWKHHNPDALKQVLLDQLGLELVPSRESIEMLVVEKAQ